MKIRLSTIPFFMFVTILSEVTSWTVDLEEVHKLFSDKEQPQDDQNETINFTNNENEILYTTNYAERFKYGTFKRNEAGGLIKNGTIYLEGLSKALADYRETLDNCSRNSSKPEFEDENFIVENATACEKATKTSEYVRKLSELALLKTNELRDKTYDGKYQGNEGEENELILQLAWTLDRLSYLTGYEPNPKNYLENSKDISTTSTETVEELTTEDYKTLEILEQVENSRSMPVQSSKSRNTKSVRKRNIDDPLDDIMKYYIKFKLWNGSNLLTDNSTKENDEFDVGNNLKVLPIGKRSVTPKKAINMRIKHSISKMNKRFKSSKIGIRKLISSIKIYRRKIIRNNTK